MMFIKFWWLLLVFCRNGSTWEDPFAQQFSGAQEPSLGGSSIDQLGASFSGAQEPSLGGSSIDQLGASFSGVQEPSLGGSSIDQLGSSFSGAQEPSLGSSFSGAQEPSMGASFSGAQEPLLGASFSGAQEPSLGGSSVDQLGASFSGAVGTPRPEVQDLWPSFQDKEKKDADKEQSRDPRNTLDDMLASFSQTPVKLSNKPKKGERAWQKEADAWYRDLTKNNALKKRSDSKKVRSVSEEKSKYVIDRPDKTLDNSKPKYKEWSNEGIVQKHEGTLRPPQAKDGGITNLDAKLKHVQKMLSDQEHLEEQDRLKAKDAPKKEEPMAENLPDFGNAPVPDGVYERTLSRLSFSHGKSNKENQVKKSPEFSEFSSLGRDDNKQKSPEFSEFSSSLGQDDNKQKKRSFSSGFNPMDEIKLKTSIRLMRKGFGPLLPSSSLDLNRNQMADSKELEDMQHPQFDTSGQDNMNMKPYNLPEDNTFDYIPSKDVGLNMDQMMDLPKSYDKKIPQYEPLPNVLDYEPNNPMPSDWDRFRREPNLGSTSLGTMELASLEAVEKAALKTSKENKKKPFEGDNYLILSDLGLDTKGATALDSTKENESKEKSKESFEYNKLDSDLMAKPERKLDSVEGKEVPKPLSEFEAKLLELDVADGILPSKVLDMDKEVRNSDAEHDIVSKVENDDDMLKMNFNLKLKEPESKSEYEEASKLEAKDSAAVDTSGMMSYPDAVAKLMADERPLFQDRLKRDYEYRQLTRQRRRAKRSLGENAETYARYEGMGQYNNPEVSRDNDSMAHVYDPTKYMVPMMNQRPLALPLPQPHQVLQQQQPLHQQANQHPLEISNFKASFNLSNLFTELQKMQPPKQPVQKQPSVQMPIQQTVTPVTTTKPTSAPIKSFGIHRFFGPFFKLKTTSVSTIDPDCVSITTPDGNATTPEPGTGLDNPCDSPSSVKVNVSINANVCANLKMKQFYSNGSIILTPNKELAPPEPIYKAQVGRLHRNKDSMDSYMDKDERQARRVAGDINEWEPKHGKNQRETKNSRKRPIIKHHEPGLKQGKDKHIFPKVTPKINSKIANKWTHREDSYDRLVSGELSKEIVAAVFEAVRNDPELSLLLPILELNLKDSDKEPKNDFEEPQIKDSFLHRQTCIPLRPDLQEFYDLVLKTADEEEKLRQKAQDEVMEKRLTASGYTPRFAKLLNKAESFKGSG